MKKKLLVTSILLSFAFSINSALASEDIIYYDNTSLDKIFDNYPDFDRQNSRAKDLVIENKSSAPKTEEIKDESTKEDVYHYQEDGTKSKGLTDTGEVRRYFDKETGQMVKNKKIPNENIFVDQNGEAHYIGWDYYNGKLGYYDPQTGYTKGLKQIDGKLYGFDENGNLLRSRNRVFDGQNYYFDKFGEGKKTSGSYPRGWVGDRYYFADGSAASGLVTIGGKKYIFNDMDKRLLRNVRATHNHKVYKTDKNGVASFVKDVKYNKFNPGTHGEFEPGFSEDYGRKTPYFNQNDKRWEKVAYATSNMSDLGCGPTAMAMVLARKFNSKDIYPTNMLDVADNYSSSGGTYWQYFTEGSKAYGLKTYEVPVNEKAFIQALKENPLVVRVGPGHFIFCGHFLVIDSYKDGYFYINDPNYAKRNTLDKHTWSRLKKEVTVAWEIK